MFPAAERKRPGEMGRPAGTPAEGEEAIEVVCRDEWNALGPISKEPNLMPVQDVYFTETETKSCSSKSECIEIIKGIQKFHMEYRGLSDIHYHFLIGGDGRVYEGRGWFTKGPRISKRSKIPQDMASKYIEIAFIGEYDEKEPSQEMQDAVNSLIAYGMENQYLETPEEGEENADRKDKHLLENKDKTDDDEEGEKENAHENVDYNP